VTLTRAIELRREIAEISEAKSLCAADGGRRFQPGSVMEKSLL
jgi:hypothetical protein